MPPRNERALSAQIAIRTRWAKEPDRVTATKPARDGLRAKFEREADPDGVLSPEERAYRGEQLHKAHMARMSLAAAKARRAKAAGKTRKRPAPDEAA